MRIGVLTTTLASTLLITTTTLAGQPHYLKVEPDPGIAKSIAPPDLTAILEANHESGVAGVNPVFVNVRGRINSDSGHLAINLAAAQPQDQGQALQPNGWTPAVFLEEQVKPQSAATKGIRASLKIMAGAGLKGPNLGAKLNATLVLGDQCQIYFSRPVYASGVMQPDEHIDCGADEIGYATKLEGNALTIELPDIGNRSFVQIRAQLDISFTHPANNFVGSIDSYVEADLVVDGIGGALVATSPTFNTLAPRDGVDAGGAPDSGSGPPSNGPPGTSPPGISPGTPGVVGAAPAEDDGCNASGSTSGSSLGSAGAVIGLAIAASMVRRRRVKSS